MLPDAFTSWWSFLANNYLPWLLIFSALVAVFEVIWPARDQKVLRKWMWSDVVHMVFNGNFLGAWIVAISARYASPLVESGLASVGMKDSLYFNAIAEWGVIPQVIVGFFILDFTQWLVHNTLHRVDFLWELHKVHHSVKEGEMDWIVSLRFSWLEIVIYKAAMFIPTVWFGLSAETLFFHAVFGTLVGHLNHANVTWDYGPLRYLFNSPRMHLYHHAYDAPAHGQNFGISLSCWDWIFGTDHLPDEPCPKIGFPGVEDLPNDFFGQMVWPLPHWFKGMGVGTRLSTSALGVVVLGGLYGMSLPPKATTPMFGEQMASSQPVSNKMISGRAESPEELSVAVLSFGAEAKASGWSASEYSVSPTELAIALGAPDVRILDVRADDKETKVTAQQRFESGHIPSAQLVLRSDYSGGDVPGVSLELSALQAFLRARGVNQGDEVVIMGDGGPEPYRLWWTLMQVGGLKARVLDGGLAGWKRLGESLAAGPGLKVEEGDVTLPGGPKQNLMWTEIASLKSAYPELQFVDTRSIEEFNGEMKHGKAARAGRIPGAKHLDWTDALKLVEGDVPVLKSATEMREMMQSAGFSWEAPLVTYCQSGTRSAAVYYALLQAGFKADQLWNYDGSWAEYSRGDLEVETGAL